MGMSRAQIAYEKCKRVARDNTKCMSILLKLLELDREDIIDQITEINKIQYDSIKPAGIVKLYENHNDDIEAFVKAYDTAYLYKANVLYDYKEYAELRKAAEQAIDSSEKAQAYGGARAVTNDNVPGVSGKAYIYILITAAIATVLAVSILIIAKHKKRAV